MSMDRDELLRELAGLYQKAMTGHSIPVKVSQDILKRVDAHLNAAPDGKLTKPAQVGNGVFRVGVSERLVIERAQREYEYQNTPERLADRQAKFDRFMHEIDEVHAAPQPSTAGHGWITGTADVDAINAYEASREEAASAASGGGVGERAEGGLRGYYCAGSSFGRGVG